MKDEILALIATYGNVSFVELQGIEGFKGDMAFGVAEKNIWFWPDCSDEAADALESLLREGKITMRDASLLTYLVDGSFPRMPIAKRNRAYKEPHWAPVVFNAGK